MQEISQHPTFYSILRDSIEEENEGYKYNRGAEKESTPDCPDAICLRTTKILRQSTKSKLRKRALWLDSVENHAWAPPSYSCSTAAAAPDTIHTHASRVRYLCKGNGKCVIVIVAASLASQANSYYNKTLYG